jgi:sterol desaturase/sphingolipid hydroxylase (fatty acid hydroxylase superfamily)
MNEKILIMGIILTILYIWENLKPYYKKSDIQLKHDASNVSIAVFNGALMTFLNFLIVLPLLNYSAEFKLGFFHVLPESLYINYIIIFLLFDMWMYWWHRINHQIKFLWLFHRAHHNDINMNTTTMFRFHPVELLFSTFFRIPVFIILGMPIELLFIFEIILNSVGMFHHSNISLNKVVDKVLRIFIVTPEIHRFHHSQKWNELNTNYSSFLSLWDRLFFSYMMNNKSDVITQGLPIMRSMKWQNPLGILKSPFIKRGLNE